MKYQLLFAKNAINDAWINADDNPEKSCELANEAISWLEDYKSWLDHRHPEDKPEESTTA